MTEQERNEIKSKLIELGFCGTDDEGDPTADEKALGVLLERMEERLAVGLLLSTDFADAVRKTREVRVLGVGIDHPLAAGDDLFAAICRTALALPDFLRQHPECARDGKVKV